MICPKEFRLKTLQPCTAELRAVTTRSAKRRPAAVPAFIVATFLFCGVASPASAQSSTSGSLDFTKDVVAIGIGVAAIATVVVVVAVVHSHHTLTGCVAGGPSEFELQTSDAKTYALEGMTTIKVGDRIKFHGTRVKNAKDSTGNPVFKVQSLKKDYGPCHKSATSSATAAPWS